MSDATALDEFRLQARRWLAENARPKAAASSRWGEGPDGVAVFHDLPADEERALIDVLPGAGLDVGGDWVEVQHVVQEAVGERVPTHDVRCDELPMPRQVQHLVLIQDEIALQCQAGDGLTDRRCADLKSLDQPGSSWWHTGLVQLEH